MDATIPQQVSNATTLRAAVRGNVHVPGDAGYDAARMAFNVTVDQRPAVVVEAAEAADVAAAVRYAKRAGLKVTGQAGGHGAQHHHTMVDTVAIRTNAMRAITLDVERETARVGAGVRWGELMAVAGEYGLVGIAGSAADVGVVGYTLGGGLSWFGRRYGFSAHNVVSIELVDARGEVVTVTASSDPELFWALRGGGGSFGIVTAIEIELKRAPRMFGGQVAFPGDRAEAVFRAWREATRHATADSSLTFSITNVPPFEDIPAPIRGRSIVNVGLVHLGDEAVARALLYPIYEAGGAPIMDVMRPLTAAEIGHVAMDPEDPLPYALRAATADRLPIEAVEGILAVSGEGSPLTMVQVRHLGGALAQPRATHGAAGHVEAEYLVYAVGALPVPELREPVLAHLDALCAAVAPWSSGRLPLTFNEHGEDLRTTLGDETYDRLAAIKARRDPDGIFAANHTIA